MLYPSLISYVFYKIIGTQGFAAVRIKNMFYNLSLPYTSKWHLANLFHYITFRCFLAFLTSFFICLFIGPRLISYLKYLQKNGQPIRSDIPESHMLKVGTPTMGGLVIITSIALSTFLFADLTDIYIWLCLFVLISFGAVGFADDYAKIAKNHYTGISGKSRLTIQILLSLSVFLILEYFSGNQGINRLSFPLFKNLVIDLGYFYGLLAVFIMVGAANAVNLTDGLDGLAVVPIAIAAGSFGIIAYLAGNNIYAAYLQIDYIEKIGEVSIFCCSIVGACLGFLWFNAQPAEIFMGDTGSLSLGGALGTVSVITKHEILFAIIGGVFVVETLSVILQVYYFKTTGGKRIFRMAPLHHHFEKGGLKESKVVVRFWIVAVLLALIGLSSLKLR